jgi:oligopeptide transport system permease protein
MKIFFLRRILGAIPTLWIIATLTFLFLRLIPGGPFDQERQLPPEIQANLAARYGLDQTLWVQYKIYLFNLCQGDPGPSLKYLGRSTGDIIGQTLPVSLQLGLVALVLAVVVGFPLGILAGTSKATGKDAWDKFVLGITSFGISMPNFVFAAGLILLCSHGLKILPPALWEGPRSMVLPALSLSLYPMAYIARLTRSALFETLNEEYIQTARAKGLGEWQVVMHHALRNSLSSVVSILGPITAALITGSFIVEYIFAIPGMGQYFVTAVTNRDYPLVLGVTMVYAVLVILMNLLVDCAYAWLDPRVKLK